MKLETGYKWDFRYKMDRFPLGPFILNPAKQTNNQDNRIIGTFAIESAEKLIPQIFSIS